MRLPTTTLLVLVVALTSVNAVPMPGSNIDPDAPAPQGDLELDASHSLFRRVENPPGLNAQGTQNAQGQQGDMQRAAPVDSSTHFANHIQTVQANSRQKYAQLKAQRLAQVGQGNQPGATGQSSTSTAGNRQQQGSSTGGTNPQRPGTGPASQSPMRPSGQSNSGRDRLQVHHFGPGRQIWIVGSDTSQADIPISPHRRSNTGGGMGPVPGPSRSSEGAQIPRRKGFFGTLGIGGKSGRPNMKG
ncbi:hypothetical protein K474DRAFT_1774515 [Panus rudis PR-1116 ss-1]|nr:hypothetical protein K474DRAFT_1774515 [Panus rudis PR-1116 ss-1]